MKTFPPHRTKLASLSLSFCEGKKTYLMFFIFSYLTNVQYLSVGENDLTYLPDEIGMTLELPVDHGMYS